VKAQTARWLRRATEDMQLARVAADRGFGELSIFHCQQALEKLLKAILTERIGARFVRRTHDLIFLTEEVAVELTQDQLVLLRRFGELYVPARYGDEDVDLEDELLFDWLRRAEELFEWLRQLLNSPDR